MAKTQYSGEDKARPSAKVDQIQYSYPAPEVTKLGTQHQVIRFDAKRLRHQESSKINQHVSNTSIYPSSNGEEFGENVCDEQSIREEYMKSKVSKPLFLLCLDNTPAACSSSDLALLNDVEAVSYTHLTLPTNREV